MKFLSALALTALMSVSVGAKDKYAYFRQSEYNGFKTIVGYYPIDEKTAMTSKEGAYRHTLNADGSLKEATFFKDGKIAKGPYGYARVVIEGKFDDPKVAMWKHLRYEPDGKKRSETAYILASSKNSGPPDQMLIVNGPLKEVWAIDSKHRVISSPFETFEGHKFQYRVKYDKQNHWSEQRAVDENGKPTYSSASHVSSARYIRDKYDNVLDIKKFDVNDKPMEVKGVHHATFKFDDKGKQIEEHDYNLKGEEVKKP